MRWTFWIDFSMLSPPFSLPFRAYNEHCAPGRIHQGASYDPSSDVARYRNDPGFVKFNLLAALLFASKTLGIRAAALARELLVILRISFGFVRVLWPPGLRASPPLV